MNRTHPSLLRSLLIVLVLAIGPWQAQTVFACAMMDTVMHECCCDDREVHKDCVDSSYDAALGSSQDPCCERAIEVSLDEDARQDSPITKPVEVRSDVDPPQAIVASIDVLVRPQSVASYVVFSTFDFTGRAGSDTYLITQRLRI